MPNRILKESICTSDSVDSLTWFEEVLFYRLIVNCDDYGRFDARPAIVKNRLFPLKETLTTKAVSAALDSLASKGLVILYEFEGKPYLCLPTWNEHQNVRAKKSKYPAPVMDMNTSEIICNQMQSNVPVIQSNPNPNPNPNTKARDPRFSPPSVEEVLAYCEERSNGVDAQAFCDFYVSKGWKVGNSPMKDWKAAVRTWERREKTDAKKLPAPNRDNSWMREYE